VLVGELERHCARHSVGDRPRARGCRGSSV
jgi:hypothetical protein